MIKKILIVPVFLIIVFLATTLMLPLFGINYYTVLTPSMTPVVKVNALVYINTNKTDIIEDDIVAVKTGGLPFLHRVVKVEGNEVETKGEQNDNHERFPRENIIGVMAFQIPYIGWFFKNKYLPWITIMAILLYIVGNRFYEEIKKAKKREN